MTRAPSMVDAVDEPDDRGHARVVAVCTDSGAQIPPVVATAAGIHVVPLTIVIDGATHLEGVDIDADGFWAHFANGRSPEVSTAAPSPGQFRELYARLASVGYDAVVSVHTGSMLSGICNAARLAASDAPVDVRLVDTGSASFMVGVAALAAADAVRAGASAEEAVERAESVSRHCGNVFVVGTLDLAIKGGRVTSDVAGRAGEPGVPVLRLHDGVLESLGNAGTVDEAVEKMAAEILTSAMPARVGIGIADDSTVDVGAALEGRLTDSGAPIEIIRYRVGPSVGAHTGPGTAGAVYHPLPAPARGATVAPGTGGRPVDLVEGGRAMAESTVTSGGSEITDPRVAAGAVLGAGRWGLVVEPSPRDYDSDPWFADDPLDDAGDPTAVSPLLDAPVTWDSLTDPAARRFAADRWLGALRRLGPPPASLAHTREQLRALAFYVLAPARQAANGKIGLRWTKGGFGTPYFGRGRQVRVDGLDLVVTSGDDVRRRRLTTLAAAATELGIVPGPPTGIDFHDAPPEPDIDASLDLDPVAVAYLDDWFGFATLVLERLRARAGSPPDTRVQIWPEHFDPAIELGDAEAGTRASYGASPGDENVPVPYLYIAPWQAQAGDFWSYPFGAAHTVEDLVAADDQASTGLAFFERGRELLG